MPQMAPSTWLLVTSFVFLVFLAYKCMSYFSCPLFLWSEEIESNSLEQSEAQLTRILMKI